MSDSFAAGIDGMSQLAQDNPQFANQAPGAAYDAFSSAAPDLAVPAIAQGLTVQAASQAVADNSAQQDSSAGWGWLGNIGRALMGGPVGTALEYMGKPLQEIQKDYKYIHSVYTRHGIFEGLAATAFVAGGAALGTLAGPEGTLLGADAAAAIERNTFGRMEPWKDSFADSENPNYKVSFGRDVANFLGWDGNPLQGVDLGQLATGHAFHGTGSTKATDEGLGKLLSGSVDMIADVTFDPVRIVAQVPGDLAQGRYLEVVKDSAGRSAVRGTTPLARRPAVEAFMASRSLKVLTTDQLDLVRYGAHGQDALNPAGKGSYNDALDHIAGLDTAGVVLHYPSLRQWSDMLGKANTPDKVHQFFKDTYFDGEIRNQLSGPAMLPTRTVMRAGGQRIADMLRQGAVHDLNPDVTTAAGAERATRLDQRGMLANQSKFFFPHETWNADANKWQTVPSVLTSVPVAVKRAVSGGGMKTFRDTMSDAIGSAVAKKVRTFSGYQPFAMPDDMLGLSKTKFDLLDPEALEGMRRQFYYSMGQRTGDRYINQIAAAQKRGIGALAEVRNLWHSSIIDMAKAAGLPDDSPLVAKYVDDLGKLTDDPAGREYGVDEMGRDRSIVQTPDGSRQMAIGDDQTNSFGTFVDFREFNQAIRQMGAVKNVYGHVDDFLSRNWTNKIFKPLALLTAGFGLRIAAAEAIPAFMRYGAWNMVKANIHVGAAKAKYRLAPGEDEAIADRLVPAVIGHEEHFGALEATTPDDIRTALNEAGASDAPAVRKYGTTALLGQGVRLYAGDMKSVAGRLGKFIGDAHAKGIVKIAGAMDPADAEMATRIFVTNNAVFGNQVARTGRGAEDDMLERHRQIAHLMQQKNAAAAHKAGANPQYMPTGKYGQWYPHDSEFKMHWLLDLQKQSQQLPMQDIARDVLEGGDFTDAGWAAAADKQAARIAGKAYDPTTPNKMGADLPVHPYKAEMARLERYIHQDPSEFGYDRTMALRGKVTGQDGTVHEDILQQIANGEKPTAEQLDALPQTSHPLKVIGPELEPYAGGSLLSRITQGGFTKVVDPIINRLSREPLYFAAVKREMRSLDFGVQTGRLTDEQALGIAQYRATHAILPQIHNTALRTQFAVLANNFLPFYFAQEQAYKRSAHLIMSDPSAIRKYQLVNEGLSNPAFVQQDANGNRFLMVPGMGAMGTALQAVAGGLGLDLVTGLPVSAEGSMSSLSTVLPEVQMPGVSPFLSLAAKGLAQFDPNLTRAITSVVGDRSMNQSWLTALVPNAPVRNALIALSPVELDRSLENAQLSAIAAAYYHGQVPPPGASAFDKQAFYDRIKNNARSILFMKALLGTVSPLAPTISQEDPGLRDEWQKISRSTNWPDSLQKFLGQHGDAAISYTVSKTASGTDAYTPYTNAAINWIQGNKDAIAGPNNVGAAYLVPQSPEDGGDAQAIHGELIKMHLREQRTPDDFLSAVYVATGNNSIAAASKVHQTELQRLTAGGDSAGLDAERKSWGDYVTAFGTANPLWWDDYQSSAKTHTAEIAIQQLNDLFRTQQPDHFYTEQTAATAELLTAYNQHDSVMKRLRANQISDGSLTDEKNRWKAILIATEAQTPILAPVIRSVFMRTANL